MAYRGQIVTLPIGLQGFSGSKNPSKMGPGHFSYVEGVNIDGGVLIRDGGALKLNSVALLGNVLTGINWSPIGAEHHDVVMLSNGTTRKDVGLGTFPTLLRSGLVAPLVYPPHFATGGGETVGQPRKLFMFTEGNQAQVVLGTANTMAAISGPAADWTGVTFPIFGCMHDLRLWAGGNANDPHRIYYSQTADHQIFNAGSAGTLAIYPGEGEIIVGAVSFRGLLLVFKRPRGVYVVDTRDADVANWQVQKLNGAVGAAGPHCITQISNDILLLDQGGNFHLMTAVTDFGDINASNIGRISDMSTFMRENISLTNIHKAVGAWYANKSQAWLMVPQIGFEENNLRVMVDFGDPQVGPRYLLSRRDEGEALWMRPDSLGVERPTLGDLDGFVYLLDDESRNKDSLAYSFAFDTAETDLSFAEPGLAAKSKNGAFLEITADLINNTTLNITPYWEGVPADPIVMTLGGAGAALGTFTLDVDALASSGIVTKRARLTGGGRRIKLSVTNNEVDNEVRISEVRLEFGVADERIRND